ncbi:hypothetical protein LTR56_020440 [Elasticomyces elasticus]|nr:hypothetical protein LTR56_020440 [Elasticomyces elasticus]KAK3666470.1 hypothetical protein LTR22_002775 [Elasticomyces elasticus]KAK4931290.1 hypothetical protein LTR49_002348 [Elasticomyces elasticus]KAK5767778.1 hypothetical protein LTS12_001930 [Elasticomyces elasticus]
MPSFADLPVELVVEIAGSVGCKDLCSLRLVNREVAAAVFETYATKCFHTQTHIGITHSLQLLSDVTASSQFSRRIQCVRLVGAGLPEGYKAEPVEPEPEEDLNEEERQDRAVLLRTLSQATYGSGTATALLAQAFGNVRAAGITPTIQILDTLPLGSSFSGLGDLQNTLNAKVQPEDLTKGDATSLIVHSLAAIAISRFPVKEITITANNGLTESKLIEILPMSLFEAPHKPFEHLASLDICPGPLNDVFHGNHEDHDPEWAANDLQGLLAMFSSAQNLLHFGLDMSERNKSPSMLNTVYLIIAMVSLEHCMRCTKLRSLSLRSICADSHRFISLRQILDFAPELCSLRMTDLVIPAGTRYTELLQVLVDYSQQLTKVGLHRLEVGGGWFLAYKQYPVDWSIEQHLEDQPEVDWPACMPKGDTNKEILIELIEHERYYNSFIKVPMFLQA